MKRISKKEKCSYLIDKLLSKGTGVLICALFSVTVVVVLLVAGVMLLIDPTFAQNPLAAIWGTFMFALDAGTLAGYTSTGLGILALSAATICGIFITSMLISVLSAGLESKLESLRRGDSRVLEQNHTVIIGYNENVFVILDELITANENVKNPVFVVLGDVEKTVMESEIADRISDTKHAQIICRSGASADLTALARCSIETAKSIIINSAQDAETIKTILAVTHILQSDEAQNPTAHITASINAARNVDVARIAGAGRAEIIYFKSAVSRIIANTCHQPGLSEVYTELFDFDGDEIYIEKLDSLCGKTFGEIINLFEVSSVLGIKRGALPMLNPPMDTVLAQGDSVILLAEDDGVSTPSKQSPLIDATQLVHTTSSTSAVRQEHLLVLGYNELLPAVLTELDYYVAPGSIVTVGTAAISDEETAQLQRSYHNISVRVDVCDIYNGEVLERYLDSGCQSIIVLSRLDCDVEDSDAHSLMLLLHLKSISERRNIRYNVVSQMLSPKNGKLAKIAKVNDFVISTNLTSLMLSQISENRDLAAVFEDILDVTGSELYMKPASMYLQTGIPVTLYTAYHAAMLRGECMLGYKTVRPDGHGGMSMTAVTNPPKTSTVVFTEDDWLILLAEEG